MARDSKSATPLQVTEVVFSTADRSQGFLRDLRSVRPHTLHALTNSSRRRGSLAGCLTSVLGFSMSMPIGEKKSVEFYARSGPSLLERELVKVTTVAPTNRMPDVVNLRFRHDSETLLFKESEA